MRLTRKIFEGFHRSIVSILLCQSDASFSGWLCVLIGHIIGLRIRRAEEDFSNKINSLLISRLSLFQSFESLIRSGFHDGRKDGGGVTLLFTSIVISSPKWTSVTVNYTQYVISAAYHFCSCPRFHIKDHSSRLFHKPLRYRKVLSDNKVSNEFPVKGARNNAASGSRSEVPGHGRRFESGSPHWHRLFYIYKQAISIIKRM